MLHQYVHEDPYTLYMLNNHKVHVIPMVNVDGFKFISDHFMSDPKNSNYEPYVWKRKNNNNKYVEVCKPPNIDFLKYAEGDYTLYS